MTFSRIALVLLLAGTGTFTGCQTQPATTAQQRITMTKGDRLDGTRMTGERIDIAPLLPLMLGAKPIDSWVLWKDQRSVRLDDGVIVHFARDEPGRFRIAGVDGTLEVSGAATRTRFNALVESVFAAATTPTATR